MCRNLYLAKAEMCFMWALPLLEIGTKFGDVLDVLDVKEAFQHRVIYSDSVIVNPCLWRVIAMINDDIL